MNKSMKHWFFGLIDRLLVVAGALIFSQLPQFFSQYMHRLAGHADELRIHIKSIQQAALKNGLEVPEYLLKFSQHQDPAIGMHGELLHGMFQRHVELSQASLAFQESTSLTRPFIFFHHFNFEIAKSTFAHFQPGIQLTLEGAIYAMIGMGAGYICFRLIYLICTQISARFAFFRKKNPKT